MPSKPVLSEEDKEAIRGRLRELCEACWTAQGYKKTGIKQLCEQAAVSIGTFYTLYPTKEDLFLETIETIQGRLAEELLRTSRQRQSREGFAQALKELFREYDSKPFLYNVSTPDFQSFLSKLPAEAVQKIRLDSFALFGQAVQAANLTLQMAPSQAYGILCALLSIVSARETLSAACDYLAVFDCMADTLVSRIFR